MTARFEELANALESATECAVRASIMLVCEKGATK